MSATAPSSASLPASAKAPWSCSSCTSIWQRFNDGLHARSKARMTEISTKSPPEELIAKLRGISVFSDLPQDDLLWFVSKCNEHRAAVGGIIMNEGDPADSMLVMLEGEMRARSERVPDGPVFTVRGGEVTGLLPFSRLKILTITGRAVLPMHYLMFHASNFPELFHRMPELTRRLVGLLADRIREVTRTEQQREKLASLGKLSAGLAHELNNPSAAARRSAAALRDCLARLRAAARSTKIGPDDCAKLAQTEEEIRSSLTPAQFKDEFARVEREEAIQSWLESHNVPEAWKLAPHLADANLADDHLARFAGAAGASVGSELTRFATLLEMDRIAEELENSSARISDLIRAIKEYSYMDQGS